MASNESSSVTARMKDLKDSVKERFLGLLGIRQPKVLLEDEQEVFLQVGRTVWHAPRQLRVELWLSSLARRHSLVSEYQTYLSQEISREASIDIDKDVQRTFPSTRRFHAEEGQTQLRNVLRAYAAYDPEVAYCQGMNFLTGLLLMYMPSEAHAFAGLVVLMEDRKLRNFYHRSMALLQVQLWQLSRLIHPGLNHRLEALGVVPMLYGASWLMTAFSADFPIPFSARIMDVLLADQCECALLKVSAAIMTTVKKRLEESSDLEEVLGYLKIEVPAWDEAELHDLLTAAFTKPWTARQLSVLRSTEGSETVAQAMDRVMAMNEQLSTQTCDDEDGGDDAGGDGEARVALTVPRLQPPPQPSNSFSASPACGTPINGGMYGTGSHGGGGASPPAAVAAAVAAAAAVAVSAAGGRDCSGGGGGAAAAANGLAGAGSSSSTGGYPGTAGGAGGGNGGALVLLQGATSAGSSPATWGIPCIHPNVPASPALQAFRRAHLPCFQAAASTAGGARNGGTCGSQHPPAARSSCGGGLLQGGSGSGDLAERAAAADGDGPGGDGDCGGSPTSGCPAASRRGSDGCAPEEWGDFNVAAVRQQWRSRARAPPGSTRHVLMHFAEAVEAGGGGGADMRWPGAAATAPPLSPVFSASYGGSGLPASRESSGGSASQPIPVPVGRSGSAGSGAAAIGSAFAAAAAAAAAATAGISNLPSSSSAAPAIGKPPLPPRCASLERSGLPLMWPFSRLSVVAEDPLAVQMGPVAPAPSPRGSMDMHVLGRSCSQQLEGYEQQGLLLCGTSLGGGPGVGTNGVGSAATGGGVGSASCNGDYYASGTASATTGGAMLSPSGISGAMSPHGLQSPRVLAAWSASVTGGGGAATAGGGSGGGAGSDTPTTGYMPLGLERAVSGSLLDYTSGCVVVSGGGLACLPERSFSLVSPLAPPLYPAPLASSSSVTLATLPHGGQAWSPEELPEPSSDDVDEDDDVYDDSKDDNDKADEQYHPADMATDIAGDILRMLSAVDTGNAHAAYDPRAILGESMYADSPKELHKLVRTGSEHLRHLPSSSALAELAAQDLARAQEQAELMRLELEAQLQQQRASERLSCSTSGPDLAAVSGGLWAPSSEVHAVGSGCVLEAAAEAAADASAAGMVGEGGDELVFKRPTLYVDGIAMFDPKSLMADTHEAQIMFTPAVSPGASSYADPVQAGFTPTGDAATPSDREDAEDAAGGGAPDRSGDHKWDPIRCSEDGGEAEAADAVAAATSASVEEPAPVSKEGISGEVVAAGSVLTPPEVAVVALVAARNGGGGGSGAATVAVATCCSSGVAMAAAATEAAATAATAAAAAGEEDAAEAAAEGGLRTAPSASEWVDWSQAPPIQNAGAVTVAASEPAGAEATAAEAAQAVEAVSVELLPPPPLPPVQHAETQAGPALPSPLVRHPLSVHGPMGRSCALDHDLIDMASPARPLQPVVPSLLHQWTPSADVEAGGAVLTTGTGLSPGPLPPPSLQFDTVRQTSAASFSDLAAAAGGSGSYGSPHAAHSSSCSSAQAAMPYGLLPMTSSAAAPAPMAPALSFAPTLACGGGSFVSDRAAIRSSSFAGGGHRSPRLTLAHPRCDSLGVSLQSSPSAAAQHGPDEPDRILDPGAWEAAQQMIESGVDGQQPTYSCAGGVVEDSAGAQQCWSPPLVPAVGAGAGDDTGAAGASEGTVAAAAAVGKGMTASSGGCGTSGLRVLAEAISEPVPEQGSPLSWNLSASAHGTEGSSEGVAGAGSLCSSQQQGLSLMPLQPQQQQQQTAAASVAQGRGTVGTGEGDAAKTPAPGRGGRLGSWSAGLAGAGQGSGYGSGAGSRGSLVGTQGNCEGEGEGLEEVVESSPFRAALSPSLAHHIMSAYLRSEQHQQQQEQRELEERLQQQHEQELHVLEQQQHQHEQEQEAQQQQQHQQQLLSGSGASGSQLLSCGQMVVVDAAIPLDASSADTAASALAPPPAAGGSGGAFGAVVAHLSVVEELSLCGMSPAASAAASGLTSPVLGSPGRIGGATHHHHHHNYQAHHVPLAAAKALTPFALSLDDPTACRLSAEVLQAMPLPPPALQPETPTPQFQLPGSGCGGLGADARGPHASGRASLRCTGSGEGDGLSCTATLSVAGGGGCLPGGSGIVRLSCGGGGSGAVQHVTLLSEGSHENGGSGTALVLSGATAVVTATASVLQPVTSQACGARVCGGSAGGGAVLPILAPPPPPQVPLCTTTMRMEAVSAPAPQTSLPPLPLPPVLCSSSATVLCLADGTADAAFTPVAAGGACGGGSGAAAGATAFAQPLAPTWTATFDGVDDTPDSGGAETQCGGPEPRVLSSAFAAEADTPPPLSLQTRDGNSCGGGGGGGTTTTGVSTPEARLHTPDMARGMSIETSAHQ